MAHLDYYDFSKIPEHILSNMTYYVSHGEPLGGFLTKVFSNDLFGAVSMADDYNIDLLPLYVKYIYNEMPQGCHGSLEIVNAWIEQKQKEHNEQSAS